MSGGELSPGTLLNGRYTVERLLARGGMSVLYCAKDRHMEGTWVIKQMADLQADAEDTRAIKEQFRREASLLSGLSHRGLPRVLDCFSEGGKEYLVEEYIDGTSLEEHLAGKKHLSQYEVVKIADELLEVLDYLHSKGIIYRDIKPGNIMLDRAGEIRLVDFGIARFYTAGKKSDTVVVGTPGYASPEHYGKGQTDPRSDIYSLGATLHALLTGCDPSQSPFFFSAPSTLVPGVSLGLSKVIMKALELRPEDRWQGAKEMQRALRENTIENPYRLHYEYGAFVPVKNFAVQAGSILTVTASVADFLFRGHPETLIAIPVWFAFIGMATVASTILHGDMAIDIKSDGLVYRKGTTSFQASWEEIEELRVHRSAGADVNLTGPLSVKPVKFEIKAPAGSILFTPDLPHWERLVDWIIFRAGLEPAEDLREHTADQVYRRLSASS
ncbi:MAG: serine/threonine-protein kinase [Candidatus Eremiobacteraeota bacterium]|nr:serine/threonine-protein kinase [Candidatus Eremiobacteraeota bacterium]